MKDETKISCFACEGESEKMDSHSIALNLEKLNTTEPFWEVKEDSLCLEVKFKNYKQALSFVNDVSLIAEKMKHHPDISFGWGYCKLVIQTHKVNGLTIYDFELALEISKLLQNFVK